MGQQQDCALNNHFLFFSNGFPFQKQYECKGVIIELEGLMTHCQIIYL